MIEVELPDGRILEIEAGDDRAAARAAKAFLDKERGVTAPRGGAASIGFTPSSFMSLPEAEPPPQRPAPDLPLPPQADPMARQIEEYQGPQAEQTPLSLRGTRISEGIARLGFVPDRGQELLAETARPLQMDSPESFGGQRITYDEATGLERAGDQLRSGWETFKQGLAATRAKSMMEALALADKADGGASPVEAPLWAELSPEQRQGLRDRTERALGSAIQSFITSRADQQEFLRNPNVQALAEAVDSGRYRDAWRILSSDFGGIVQQASVESLPSQIPGLVGALAGGTVARAPGMLVGQFMGGYAADVGPRFVEALSRRMASEGVDGEDGAAVETWLRGNMGAMREEFQAAQRGGFGPALADTASLGLARGLRPGAGVFRNTMTGLRNMGIEIGTEGAGEAAAGIFAEGKVTPSEVLMEMLGAGPQAVGTTAIATLQEARNMGRTGAQAIEPVPNMTTAAAPRPTAAQMADEAISQTAAVAAPGSTTTINVGGQVRTMTPAPGSAGGTGAAAVPPAAPPSGEPPPPPGATSPLQGAPTPGGAAVPTVTPDNTRPSLEQALNTPTPTPDQQAEQAAQEEAQSEADRATGVQRIASSLPLGWTVDDEDQIIQVYDPNGMPVMTLVRPPATEQDFAALMTGIAAQNQEGVADGSYPQPNDVPPAPEAPVAPPTQPEAPPSAPVAPQAAPTPPQSEAPSQPAPEPPQPPAAPEPPPAPASTKDTFQAGDTTYTVTISPPGTIKDSPNALDATKWRVTFTSKAGSVVTPMQVRRFNTEAEAAAFAAEYKARRTGAAPQEGPQEPKARDTLTPRIEGSAKRLNITLAPGDVAAVQALMAEEGLSVDAALRRVAQEREAAPEPETAPEADTTAATPQGQAPAPASDLEARKAAAKAKFAAAIKASNQRLNAGIDPSVLAAGIELGLIYIEEGVVKFRAWARAVLADAVEMGLDPEAVKPTLKPIYLATSAEVADDVADQMDERAAVRAFDLNTLDQAVGEENANQGTGGEAPNGGAPAAQQPGPDPQPGSTQSNPPVVGDGTPGNVGAPEPTENDGNDGVPGAASNVGGAGPIVGGGNADNGRPRASGTGASDAGTGTGTGPSPGNGAVGGSVGAVNSPSPAGPTAGDFHIDDPAAYLGGGAVARFNRNRIAIETLNTITESDRPATREEQEKLAAYTGWGSFGQDLFKGTWERPDPRPGWEERDRWLRQHLGKDAWQSAQASIINAHYTDPPIVAAMWDMVRRAGFEGGRVLEPAVGSGNFFSLMPLDLKARSELTGIELDLTTAAIAKLLFPHSNIQQKAYQDSRTPDGFYDVVIGNWPFAGQTVADRRHGKLKPTLHDFFFLKALDQVRAGGLVIGITSNGTMDKDGKRVRAHLARNAELVAAFRLPSGAFEGYAGTAVVTDIVILKKRATPLLETPNEAWVDTAMVPTPAGTNVRLNGYYRDNPDRVFGTVNFGTGTTRGSPGLIVDRPDNLLERLNAAVALVPDDAYERERKNDSIAYITNHTNDREGALVFQGNEPFIVRGEQLAPAGQVSSYAVKNAKETAARVKQMRDLVEMRRAYADLITKERTGEDAQTERTTLRGLFDAFQKAYGPLRESYGMRYLDKIDDPFFPALAALVQKDGTPAAILSRSTIRVKPRLENPSITDAFVLARQQSIRPTLGEISQLTGKPTEEVKATLLKSGAVFETVSGDIEPADLYLSGNVRMKLREAEAAVREGQTQLQRNVDALKEVQPRDVPYYDIEVQFGATWVPEDVYEAYVAHMLNRPDTEGVSIRFTLGRWKARLSGLNNLPAARSGFGMDDRRVPFSRLLQAAISNQTFKVMAMDPITKTEYVDQDATKTAADRIANIRSTFKEWIWSDVERRVALEQSYNETRNSHATPKYDGSFMSFEGMALTLGRGEFQLRQHQVNAIWRAVVNRKSINAHEVGTGKTFTMGGIAVESRRYGIAKKPLILAHNANSKAVATEIQAMYPAAKVLYIDNLAPADIEVQLRRIANDDWDAVVLPHSQIDRLALSRETLMEIAKEEIAALEEAAMEAANDDNTSVTIEQMDAIRAGDKKASGKLRSPTAKDLVRARNSVLNKIDALAIRASRDKAVQFENLGIDMILVDEAHEFKKPPIVTGMKMKGLQTATSDMSIALNFLTSYVRRQNNGNNIHTFTGTPITNTLVEIFHQMRYVMLEEMKSAGVDTWDAWFGSFSREVQDVELSAAGEYEPITRLAAFINVPELRRLVGQYLDVVFGDDMPEMQPRQTKSGKTMASSDLSEAERAELENGRTDGATDRPYKKVINVTSEMTDLQVSLFEQFQADARRFRNARGKDRRRLMMEGDPASPVIVEGGANLASFDERMYDRNRLADSPLHGMEGKTDLDPRSKVAQVVKNVMEIYRSDPRANQVIFADQGYNTMAERAIPLSDPKRTVKIKTFSAIKDMVERLVAEGIPREQIALVTGGLSPEKKFEISQAMNEGRLRVAIGLSGTLGVGVNMQLNLRAMHHMDAPYMPGDLEQRNGRGWRQGNQWNTVLEYRYITDRLDGRRWQILAIKQRFIAAFMRDNNAARVIEGEAAADAPSDFLESFAEAAGDPRALIREQMKRKLEQLQQAERMHGRAIADANSMLREQLSRQKSRSDWLEAATREGGDLDVITSFIERTKGDGFTATIGGRVVTKRADAEQALQAAGAELRQGDASRPIGQIGGVKVSISWPKLATAPEIKIVLGREDFEGKSIASIEAQVRNYPSQIPRVRDQKAEADASIERLREVVAAPFSRKAQLVAAKQALADLEADLAANPVAPPGWLRIGAPRDSTVFWRGKPFTVTGHRWTSDGWFVLAEDERGGVVIPYMEATDQQGIPAYEERKFTPPVVVDPNQPGGQSASPQPPGATDEGNADLSFSAPSGWDNVGDLPAVEPITPDAMRALLRVLRQLAGGQAVLEISASGLGDGTSGAAAGALVRLAYSIGKVRATGTVFHEAIHVLRNLGKITSAEWTILTDAANREGWAARFDIEERYRKLYAGRFGPDGKTADGRTLEEMIAEEAVAEAFADWATGYSPPTDGPVASIFKKIRQFLIRLRNAMRGRGFRDERDIFEAITRGELGARPAQQNPRLRGVPDARRSINRTFGDRMVVDADTPQSDIPAWLGDRPEDVMPLYANPFDPALFMRLFGRPAARAVRAAAAGMRERNVAAVKANWAKSRLPPGVVVKPDAQSRDLLPLWSVLQRPTRMFRKWPAVAALVDQGIAAERRMNNWQTRMNGRMELILRTLEKQKGDRAKVAAALFDADANEVDIARKDVADKHFAAHDLSPAEATAARELNALVRMSARLVDNHRRATMPKVRKRKAEIWNSMTAIMDRASVKSPEYKKLYARRARLNAKIRNNVGDLAAHAAEIESINTQLRMMRAADPKLQERMAELQTEYDALEARLANTSVQRRVGYFPHKFFGSWRMFKIEGVDDETGEQIRTEITSDQGFYDTEEQAVEAARAYLKDNPGAQLRIERKVSMLPSGAGGAVLSDAGYSRLRRGLEEQTGIEGQELNDMLSGVARRRSRRRVFAPGMFRTGAEGFSEDIQRVLRTHISQSVRYVEMDKLKFAYVATTERLGLSPSRAQAIKTEGKAELLRALESWWTDVNGNKQQSEAVVDGLLNKLGLPGSTMAAVAAGAAAMGASNPILAGAFGGYLGFRMYNAIRKGGDFPTRTLMGDLTSDMAHLKLGMLVNIASSVVNLSQTLINTYPVLGEKWTAIGIKRALPAMLSQARNRDKPGMMSADAILLRRADVMTDISIQADAAPLLAEDAGLVKGIKRASMAPFMAAEHFNRAVAFMGALARAEAKGLSPAAAFQEAQAVLKKTQFHQGIADRPELLRVTVLKLPTQFKNFMIQQIGFAFDLAGDTFKNPAPVARFLLGLFLAAGIIGILPLALADWMLDYGFGVSPIRWMKDRAIRAGIMGEWSGTMADFLMRGLPTLLQMDLSGRVGMGQGFIPNSPADLMQGPFIGTAVRLRELASNNRQEIVDYLGALSPAANPLRMLEAAANGATIDSTAFWSGQNFFDGRTLSRNPQMRGMPEYNMTNTELVMQGAGFRPLRSSLFADDREIARAARKEGRKDANAYLQEMIQAERNGRPERIPEIRQEAAQNGVRIPPQRVRDALRDARRDRPERDLRNAPRDMRPEMRERLRGIDARELGPALAR